MLFNSVEFIFFFLPVVLGLYLVAGKWLGKEYAITWLVLASLFFYGWWEPRYLFLILMSMLFNFLVGKWLHNSRSRMLLSFGIGVNLAALVYYKYAGFLVWNYVTLTGADYSIPNIVLPLAISFFTFQQIAYLVDSWKGITGEYHFLHYALFVTFFPQLIAGPIVHHKEMLPQFERRTSFKLSQSDLAVGISIFAIGLFKKTIIADGMATYANPVFAAADSGSSIDFFESWLGVMAYTFQLYFDFSGYSDMALGLARIFGIVLPLNFYSPYKSATISEFWRRWHMTLSRFLRDYIYIALGGNRKGPRKRYLFLMTTMLLGGIWHGAGWNFLIWGGLHGIYLVINHSWVGFRARHSIPALPVAVSWLITMMAVMVGWAFFRATTMEGSVELISGMFGLNGFALPNALLARMGELGPWLESHGVIAYHGGARVLLSGLLYCFLLIPVVLTLPNVQDLFHPQSASLSSYHRENRAAFWPAFHLTGFLRWSPRATWSVYCSAVLILGVMTLGQISDFLYFQF